MRGWGFAFELFPIWGFPNSKRSHTQISASTTPQSTRLSSLLKCRTWVIWVSKRRKAALPSSRRTLTWKPGTGREKAGKLQRHKEATGGLGGKAGNLGRTRCWCQAGWRQRGALTILHSGVIAGKLHPVAILVLLPSLQRAALFRALP